MSVFLGRKIIQVSGVFVIFLVFGGFFDFFIMVAMPAHILGRSRQLKNNIDVFSVVNVFDVLFDVDYTVVIVS